MRYLLTGDEFNAEEAYRLGLVQEVVEPGEEPVSYTHLRAHETVLDLVCRLLLEKKKHLRTHTPSEYKA